MTSKEREDRFIAKCREDFGALTWETELLLRYGYAAGASEHTPLAYQAGILDQRDRVLAALHAADATERDAP